MSSDTARTSFLQSRLVAALVSGFLGLVGVLLGFWLGTRTRPPESFDISISAKEYPLVDTNIRINEGDEVEIRVMEANDTIWYCGTGVTNAMGFAESNWKSSGILPSANFCALIGRVEGGPYFVVGAYHKFIADVSGSLFLGVNDVPPNRCPGDDCFEDNSGEQFVKVTINRR
jgi:hypothetical protein